MKTMNERTENAMTSTCALKNDLRTKKAGKGGPSRAFRALAAVTVMMAAGAGAWGQGVESSRVWEGLFRVQGTSTRDVPIDTSVRILASGAGYRLLASEVLSGRIESWILGMSYDPESTASEWRIWRSTATEKRWQAKATVSETAIFRALYGEAKSGEKAYSSSMRVQFRALADGYSNTVTGGARTMAVTVPMSDQRIGYGSGIDAVLPTPEAIEEANRAATGATFVLALFLKGQPTKAEGVIFVKAVEFFEGENAYFATRASTATHDQKRLALLYEFFKEAGYGAEFKSKVGALYATTLPMSASDWDLHAGAPLLPEMRVRLASAIAGQLKAATGKKSFGSGAHAKELTVLDADQWKRLTAGSLFDELYGGQRNLYISAYLAFAMEMARPPFATLTKKYSGNYPVSRYRQITAAEGNEIAAAAMRYLTWGVEFSTDEIDDRPVATGGDPDMKRPAIRISDERYLPYKPGIDAWTSGGVTGSNRTNYLPGSLPLKPLLTIPTQVAGSGDTVSLPVIPVPGFASGFTVPFADGKAGWPIPYVRGGYESPRTFAYKLKAQLEARTVYYKGVPYTGSLVSTAARLSFPGHANNLYGNYVTAQELFNNKAATPDIAAGGYRVAGEPGILKPFLPGGSASLFETGGKFAGVDSMGFLSGTLAMTSLVDKIRDLSNNPTLLDLDRYYAMEKPAAGRAPGPGLDPEGLPRYLGDPWQLSLSSLALEAADLERATVPIPDLSLVRPGDIIVRYGNTGSEGRDPVHVGVVVWVPSTGKPAYGTDPGLYTRSILVVSVREGFQQATLGTWGNSPGTFGGFAEDPSRYHARRFLAIDKGSTGDFEQVKWDVFNERFTVEATIADYYEDTRSKEGKNSVAETDATAALRERWIPNTGEFLRLVGIRLQVKNESGATVRGSSLGPDGLVPILAGAKDRKPDSIPSGDHGNIYINSSFAPGKALGKAFEIAALKGKGAYYTMGYLVANAEGGYDFDMLFGGVSSFYDASGAIKPGFGLSLDENGYLKVKIPGCDDAFLGIRPLDSASAYPGDDLLLEFGIAKAKTSVAIARDALPDSDYLAVYDKKMLWRANLYIQQVETDETGTATDDWNNLHPWNAPPVVGTVVQGGSNPVWGRPGQMDDDSVYSVP